MGNIITISGAKMPKRQPPLDPHKRAGRSRITNRGKLPGTDGRSPFVRRWKDLTRSLIEELGGQGTMNEGRRALINHAAAVMVHAEAMQARILRGEHVDVEELSRVSNVLARLFTTTGTKRPAAADKTPSLAAYLNGRDA